MRVVDGTLRETQLLGIPRMSYICLHCRHFADAEMKPNLPRELLPTSTQEHVPASPLATWYYLPRDRQSSVQGTSTQVSTDDLLQSAVINTPSSLTLEHVPSLPPPLTPPDNSTSDPMRDPLTNDQCIALVSTSPSPTQDHIPTSPPACPDKPLFDHMHKLLTNDQQCVIAQDHVPTFSLLCTLEPPDKLHPTLSRWIKNMKKLSSLVDHLHGLASSAPAENRFQLLRQVMALRATSKKQQEHFIQFLQLSDEYANGYLLDISPEIQQQGSFLDKLEERLEAAKKLHGEAVGLKALYESRTVATVNNLRATGKSAEPPVVSRQNIETLIFSTFATASRGPSPVQRGGLSDD
jgi:hypothetical protein